MTVAVPATRGISLEQSRQYCTDITRRHARNFYYGLRLLTEPKRSAMFTLYAYMRIIDDIADDEDGRSIDQRRADLDRWEEQTRQVFDGLRGDGGSRLDSDEPGRTGQTATPSPQWIWPAFEDLAKNYTIPHHVFFDAIAGQRQDLDGVNIQTFDDLQEYCRRVAGVVGLASIHIWGFESGAATEDLALKRGLAFQLTNILRDLWEDSSKGRVYLPREDLQRFGVSDHGLRGAAPTQALTDMLRFQVGRARAAFEESAGLEERVHKDGRPSLVAMTEIYRGLLEKISADPLRVMRGRVSLSVLTKLRIGWRASRSR